MILPSSKKGSRSRQYPDRNPGRERQIDGLPEWQAKEEAGEEGIERETNGCSRNRNQKRVYTGDVVSHSRCEVDEERESESGSCASVCVSVCMAACSTR